MDKNVNTTDRTISALFGSMLLWRSFRHHRFMGFIMAFVGGGLVYRAASGYSRLSRALERGVAVGPGNRGSSAPADAMEVEHSNTVSKPTEKPSP